MATLKGIVENIAYTFGEQFNETLKASIADSVIDYRAMLIRQDLATNVFSFEHYLDKICLSMELVDTTECPGITTGEKILKSTSPLPKSIRLKGMGRTNFLYVGSIDRMKPFSFATPSEMKYRLELPFGHGILYYGILNNHLYIFNSLKPCNILIEGVIEDPRTIQDCNNPDVFEDEIEFACPADLLVGIKNAIKREYFPEKITDGEEVNIERDAKN